MLSVKKPGILLITLILLTPNSAWGDVKTSERALAARAIVKPALEPHLAKKNARWGAPIFIRIFKEESELELWVKTDRGETFALLKTYAICHFSGEPGPKELEGDGQAPEGFYAVSAGRMNPFSQYHLSFDIGYPNGFDRSLKRTGGAIMVHGSCVSIGCFAMTDDSIKEIYSLAEAALNRGQPFFRVHIFPFRMSASALEENLEPRSAIFFENPKTKWRGFWTNLKEGYDYFERSRIPPDVTWQNGRYRFSR